MKFSRNNIKVLYVSGEESEAQTAMRARRLGSSGENPLVMTATDLNIILLQAQEVQPALLVLILFRLCTTGAAYCSRQCRTGARVYGEIAVFAKPAALPCLLSVM
ncbi:MAG: hypothetical protein ACLR2G_03780 [Phascolarctobacterium faecium]